MKMTLRRVIAAFVIAAMLIAALPALALSAEDYNSHDVEKLKLFFETVSDASFVNGIAINGSGYDADDPSTWGSCTWTSAGRLRQITFSDLGWNVSGALDLSGCTSLNKVIATDCFISAVDFSGCTALKTLDLTGNKLTSIDVSSCTNLELLWLSKNNIHDPDISANSKLTSFDCS